MRIFSKKHIRDPLKIRGCKLDDDVRHTGRLRKREKWPTGGAGEGARHSSLVQPVLGIRDILVRIWTRGSEPLSNKTLIRLRIQLQTWLLFSLTSGCQKKIFFPHTFFFLLARKHIIFSLENFIFCKNFASKFYFQALFQSAQHLYEKREGSGSIPSYYWLRIPHTGCNTQQVPFSE